MFSNVKVGSASLFVNDVVVVGGGADVPAGMVFSLGKPDAPYNWSLSHKLAPKKAEVLQAAFEPVSPDNNCLSDFTRKNNTSMNS